MDSFQCGLFFLAGTIQPKPAFSYKVYAKKTPKHPLYLFYTLNSLQFVAVQHFAVTVKLLPVFVFLWLFPPPVFLIFHFLYPFCCYTPSDTLS